MAYSSSLNSSALLWSMASLGSVGSGSGSGGVDGKPGSQWFFEEGPLTDGFSAPLGANPGDIVMDTTDTELFRVVEDNGNLVLASTGVTLRPEAQQQKSLYQLYLDLEPKKPLTEAQFHDAFLEALEEDKNFNLFTFYQTQGGLKYTTEADFNKAFIKLMDLDLSALDIDTDRIVSKDGKQSVISDNDGITATSTTYVNVDTVNFLLEAKGTTTLQGKEVLITSTGDTTDGSTKVQNLVDPVNDLDAVNKRTLDKAVSDIKDIIDALESKVNTLENKVDKNHTETLDLISQVNTKVDTLEVKHDREIKEVNDRIDGLETENTQLKTDIKNLAEQHVKDVDNLQQQIDNLENNIITAISVYLKEQLPGLIEEEVKKQLEDMDLGGCNCDYPPDVIFGGDAELETQDVVLVFDNGNSTSSDFEYIMADFDDPAVEGNEIYRLVNGGDADPSDDEKNKLTFEEWLEMMDLTAIFKGGNAEQKNEIYDNYLVWLGGSATTDY